MKNFNALNKDLVKLDKKAYLIEASAGTGKTYSIGLLVLRLILEQDLPISKILMVTFTNQAVAELAARIRKFLNLAIQAAEGNESEDEKPISELLKNYQDEGSVQKLKTALSELDQASIQTIHSFCQEALNSYPLESGQGFGLELQTNVVEMAVSYVNEFWRHKITTLSEEELRILGKEITLQNFTAAVKEALAGKEYSFSGEPYALKDYESEYAELLERWKKNHDAKIKVIENKEFVERSLIKKGKITNLKKWANFDEWVKLLMGEEDAKYKKELFKEVLKEERREVLQLKQKFKNVIHFYFWQCIEGAKKRVVEHLKVNQLITYDEIISRMHQAVMTNPDFKEAVREKFEAVFIDEFQDTDRLQYEIYDTLFGQEKLLFYIGDPKQSIYGWRKADLNTYFEARLKIPAGNLFKMRYNFRSTPSYVKALNNLYSPLEDPFKTGGEADRQIRYEEVESSQKTSQGLLLDGKEINPLQLFEAKDKTDIGKQVRNLIQELIHGDYTIERNYKRDKVRNSDIGILVRTGVEAQQVKRILAEAGINAVTIDDTKIFKDSTEAKSLLYILEAVLNTTENNINKALLNEFTGKKYDEIADMEKDDLLDKFRLYREIWIQSGIYAAIKLFMTDFGVIQQLMEQRKFRVFTNLNQIVELLQESEFRQELKPSGLYNYLQKQIEIENTDDDTYIQRVESDEAAVKILTIHKAKGLQYPIVIAPFLDLLSVEESYFKWFSYREPKDNGYKFYCKSLKETGQQTLYEDQKEQENSRLIYVALTRAKYNCFVFRNTADYFEHSILSEYITNDLKTGCLDFSDNLGCELSDPTQIEWKNAGVEEFILSDKHHGKLSFSALSAHSSHTFPDKLDTYENQYDQFIFKDIPGGKYMGTMLHYLFENIDFTNSNPEHHQAEVDKLVEKYYPSKKKLLRKRLVEMVDHVLHSHIQFPDDTSIVLKDLDSAKKLNEMEFDFSTSDICLEDLKGFDMGEGVEINCDMAISTQKGLLTGLIDLFFEHGGKYYILDWKSNYLGDHLDHYAAGDTMKKALNEGNYHLQYLIYSMAVKNYLEQRLPDFDYERDFGGAIYVYLRGARAGKNTGIYTNKPSLAEVEALERIFNETSPN